MCGRFASARKRQELLAEFDVQRDRVTEPLQADYNVAPTKPVYAVLTRSPNSPEEPPARRTRVDGGRRPSVSCGWSAGGWCRSGPRTLDRQPDDQRPGRDGRREAGLPPCVRQAAVPAARGRLLRVGDQRPEDRGSGPARKQPYYIYREDGGVLAFAGLYERWRDKAVPDDDPRGHAVDGHDHHHPGGRRGRPDSRPDADGDRAQPVGGLARSRGHRAGGGARAAGPGGHHAPDVTRCFDGR